MDDSHVLVTCYTDPVCTWCWGMEPVFRKLETHYGERLAFDFVMGGLIKDYHTLLDPRKDGEPGGAERLNRRIADHWVAACSKHGMPIDSADFHLFSDEHPSTYPQNIACEAAKLTDGHRFEEYLYRMRLETAAYARVTSDESVQIEIADRTGLDLDAFLGHLRDGSAEAAFKDDRERMRKAGAKGFPTFEISWGDKIVDLSGYRSYEIFTALISSLTDGAVEPMRPEQSFDALLTYMDAHPIMTIAELAAAFDFKSKADAFAFVQPLFDDDIVDLQPAGNGFTIEKPRRR